jgi:uncharacterized protein (TIGR02246 family)
VLRGLDQASDDHVRRSDAEVVLAREVAAAVDPEVVAVEDAWRLGGQLYLGRQRPVHALAGLDLTSQPFEALLRTASPSLIIVSTETCVRYSCGPLLAELGFGEYTPLQPPTPARWPLCPSSGTEELRARLANPMASASRPPRTQGLPHSRWRSMLSGPGGQLVTKLLGTLTALGLAIGLAGCAPAAPPAPPDTTAEDTAAINALRDAWATAYNAGDATALAALYADNAIRMDNESPTAVGRSTIQEAVAAQMADAPATTITLTSEEMQVMGDHAFDRGMFSATVTPAGGGGAMTSSGRYLVLLHKQADGSWKLTHTIDNTPSPAMAPVAK